MCAQGDVLWSKRSMGNDIRGDEQETGSTILVVEDEAPVRMMIADGSATRATLCSNLERRRST